MLPILTCKQAAKALADQDYASLPWWRRVTLKFHIAMCFVCRGYNRQIMVMQDGVRKYLSREEEVLDHGTEKLSEECREKLRSCCRGKPSSDA
jgi:hypothetical protein